MTDEPEIETQMVVVSPSRDPEAIVNMMATTKRQLDAVYDILVQKGWGQGAWAHDIAGNPVMHGFEVREEHVKFSLPGALSLAVIRDNPNAAQNEDDAKADLELHALMVPLANVLIMTKLAPVAVKALSIYERTQIFRNAMADAGSLVMMLGNWNESICMSPSDCLLVVQEAIAMHEKGMKYHAQKMGN